MGYGEKELCEQATKDLVAELNRRQAAVRGAYCYYCKQPLESHDCKLKEQVNTESRDASLVSLRVFYE